jgi:hypothetical protein
MYYLCNVINNNKLTAFLSATRGLKMTKQEAIEIVKNQINDGQAIVFATIGQGGAGLGEEELNDTDFISDLENSEFVGEVEPCDDIKSSELFEENLKVIEFINNGLSIQVMTDVAK